MVSPTQIAPLGTDPYVFQAGYYDLFRAGRGDKALPDPRFFAERAPRGGTALEIGPGTDRVTVLDSTAPKFHLGRRFDFVYLAGVLEHVPPRDRATLFAQLAEHLADDGDVAMDMVLAEPAPDWPERVVDRAAVGECRYEMSSIAQPVGDDQAHLRFVYRTYHRDELVATEIVERAHYLHRPEAVLSDLAAVGLTAVAGTALSPAPDRDDDPGTLVARR